MSDTKSKFGKDHSKTIQESKKLNLGPAIQQQKVVQLSQTSTQTRNNNKNKEQTEKCLDEMVEKQSAETSSMMFMSRHSDISTNHKMSQREVQRRQIWLQKARLNETAGGNYAQIKYEIPFAETYNGLHCARFSKKGNIMAACFGTGGVQIRHGETGQLISTLRSGIDSGFPVMCCRFNPIYENVLYVSTACGNILKCSIDKNELTHFIQESKNEINAIDVSIDGLYIVSGGKDAVIRLYDTKTSMLVTAYKKNEGSLVQNKIINFHTMRIFAARFHHSFPYLIITGGWDDTVRIWDIRVGDGSVRSIQGPHICGEAIDFRETKIVTGSWVVRESLQLWDLLSMKLIGTINPTNRPTTLDGEFPYVVHYFNGDPYGDHILVGGSGTGAVEIISIKKQKVMGSFPVNKVVTAIDSYQSRIVFGGMESVIRIADYSS